MRVTPNADELGVSSLHVTFNTEAEAATMTELGYLQRSGIQYHWWAPRTLHRPTPLMCKIDMQTNTAPIVVKTTI